MNDKSYKTRTIKDAIKSSEEYLEHRERRGDLQWYMQVIENQLMIMKALQRQR